MSWNLADGWARLALGTSALAVLLGGAALGVALTSDGSALPASSALQRGAAARSLECRSGAPKITETGTGTVSVTPDLLTISLDVHTTAKQASKALAENDAATAKILHALSSGGVARRDLQTTDLSIQPNYAHTGTAVTGYGVDDTVVAKIRSFSTAGTLIDAAVSAGGNATRIDSLAFSLTHPISAQTRARGIAVRQAVGDARAIARAAGERIAGICSIDDRTSTSTTPPVLPFGNAHAAASPSAPVPVEAGSQTVTSQVSVVLSLARAERDAF
ncbi:MAG: SIMPL domain-containing protein [Acidimicrobiales bacterium]